MGSEFSRAGCQKCKQVWRSRNCAKKSLENLEQKRPVAWGTVRLTRDEIVQENGSTRVRFWLTQPHPCYDHFFLTYFTLARASRDRLIVVSTYRILAETLFCVGSVIFALQIQ